MPRPEQIVHAPDALPVWPVWSKAVKSRGMVYVAGNIGCNPDVKTLVEGGIQGQTVRSKLRRVFLATTGCSIMNLVVASGLGERVQGPEGCWLRSRTCRQGQHLPDRDGKHVPDE